MVCDIFLTLPNGTKMPALGLGTWESKDNSLEEALNAALENGYRHIDTAEAYQNEEMIGKVLKKWFDSGKLKREDLFITTKLPSSYLHPDYVEPHLKESLKKLQLDYVDLYLLHFPLWTAPSETKPGTFGEPDVDYTHVWKKMEEQYDAGRAKNIGISNFNIKQVDNLLKNCRIKPANNQIELHVYLQQKDLVDFCNKKGVTVVAYSPLGCRAYNTFLKRFDQPAREIKDAIVDETVLKIGQKHSKTAAQVLLRFLLQLGVAPIPKSVSPKRVKENFDVFNFSLDKEDMAKLRGLEIGPEARVVNWQIIKGIENHPDYPFRV